MRTVFLFMILALLTGCFGHFPLIPYEYSYVDAHIRDNIYYVEVRTYSLLSQMTVVQYFHRRAKETCFENGYQDYRITASCAVPPPKTQPFEYGKYILQDSLLAEGGYVKCEPTHVK